jgi:hypothetical protein
MLWCCFHGNFLAAVTDGSHKLEVLRQHRQIFMTKKNTKEEQQEMMMMMMMMGGRQYSQPRETPRPWNSSASTYSDVWKKKRAPSIHQSSSRDDNPAIAPPLS